MNLELDVHYFFMKIVAELVGYYSLEMISEQVLINAMAVLSAMLP